MAKKVTVKKHGYFYNTVEEATVKKRGSFSEKVVEAGGGGGTEELLLRPGGNFKVWHDDNMRKKVWETSQCHEEWTVFRRQSDCGIRLHTTGRSR